MKEKFARFLKAYIRVVQRGLIALLLTLVYFLLVGPTACVYRLLVLFGMRGRFKAAGGAKDSYWLRATTEESSLETASRQS